MKNVSIRQRILVGLLASLSALFGAIDEVEAQVNSWTNTAASGLWQDATKWSLLAAPTSTHSAVFITNTTTKTVTINQATPAGNLTTINLTVAGPGGTVNTLQFTNNATPLRILNNATISTGGNLLVGSNGNVLVESRMEVAGTVTVTNGTMMVVTNGTTQVIVVGNSNGPGNIFVNGASSLLQVNAPSVGFGGAGTITLSAGTISVFGGNTSRIGDSTGSTGTVWVTGGQYINTNSLVRVGFQDGSVGRIVVSNGTLLARDVRVGDIGGGSLTVAGGTVSLSSEMIVGREAGSATGTVFVTGGQLVATNSPTFIGSNGVGQVTLTGGTMLSSNVLVGTGADSQGTLTIAGGTNTLSSFLDIGNSPDTTGTVWLTGGQLTVTNVFFSFNNNCRIGISGVGQMTVSNGTWRTRSVSVGVNPGSRGTLTVAGGTNTLSSGDLTIGDNANATGAVWVTGGRLVVTNTDTTVGVEGIGHVTVSNGIWMAGGTTVGDLAGSQGTLTVAGGTNTVSFFIVGGSPGAVGRIFVTGGLLVATNSSSSYIGASGVGQMAVSNGAWLARIVHVGFNAGSAGTLTVAGGTNTLSSGLTIGDSANATGAVWVTGGRLVVTNSTTFIANSGVGQMAVSNGTWLARDVSVGEFAGSRGTLTVAGGTNTVSTSLILGNLTCSSTGTVIVAGGDLFVTNSVTNAVLEVCSGTVTLNSGTLAIDKLVITNACGHFNQTGGTLSITTNDISANLDADGDSLPNGWEQSFGLSPFSDAGNDGAGGDFDGDGFTNLQEFIAGTDPADPASAPTVTSWTNSSGKWEQDGNWSVSAPSSLFQAAFITNATTKTVTIDATTTNTANTMTISNLTVRGLGAGTNTLLLTNAGTNSPLLILSGFTLDTNAVLVVTNSVLRVDGLSGGSFAVDGGVTNLGGGQIIVTNAAITIGTAATSHGNFTASGGRLLASNVVVGDVAGSAGTLSATGGTNSIYTGLTLGNFGCSATGTVVIAGGQLFVTNSVTNAVLEVRSGSVTLSSGTLKIDQLVITNACGHFNQTGGTLSITSTNLDPSLDVDGDGFSNQQEAIAGTSPFNASSTPAVTSWNISSGGKWEVNGNWSAGAPLSESQTVLVTNAATKTVTIDAVTTNTPSTMTISNLTVRGLGVGTNTLQLTDVGTSTPLRVLNAFTLGTNAVLVVTNSALQVDGLSGGDFLVDGSVDNLAGGQIVITNAPITIGNTATSRGNFTTLGGLLLAQGVVVGNLSQGTLTVAGGTNILLSTLSVGDSSIATGAVWVTGGRLVVTNSTTTIARSGVGQMTVSNGTWLAFNVSLGSSVFGHSPGTLTVAGGTTTLSSSLFIGAKATGTVWLTGGQLTVTNNFVIVGDDSVGRMTVSNGTWLGRNVVVGQDLGSQGTLSVVGGTSSVYSNLTIGNLPCAPTGTVVVAGGNLFVTNTTGNAALEVRAGSLILNSGMLTIDRFVMTNSCGFFTHTGGTLIYGTAVLDPNRDDDGDGISNGYEQSHGLDALNPADATLDTDGDGQTNLAEFQSGTDATNSLSSLRVTAITKESTDLRVTWMTGPGKTNALERTAGTANGSYSNNFAPIFTVTNTIGTSTNYLDVGAATNFPNSYYRVRLVP